MPQGTASQHRQKRSDWVSFLREDQFDETKRLTPKNRYTIGVLFDHSRGAFRMVVASTYSLLGTDEATSSLLIAEATK